MKYSVTATNLDVISSDFYFRFVFHSVHKISACLYLLEQLYCLNSVKFCSYLNQIRKGSCNRSYILIAIVHSKGLSVSMVTIPESS